MGRYRSLASHGVGVVLAAVLLAACTAAPATTASTTPSPPATGMVRVWFLRQADPPGGNVYASDPMVFVDGAPLAQIKQGTAFYRDLPPGTYRFTVQPFGTPAGQSDTLQLAPGMRAYVQVTAAPNWQTGSSAGGYSFAVLSMSPEVAKQYLPTLTDLGPR